MDILNPETLLKTFGMVGLFAIIFAESGLLFGFFLPGDSILFTAGLLAADGKLNIAAILIGCAVAAVTGDQVGYGFGNRVGAALFKRPDSRFFKQEYVDKAKAYFDKHGVKTIMLARFIPIVRTFAPIVAGASDMPYRTFVTFNLVGGLTWVCGVATLGYTLGNVIPNIDRYLLPIIALIIAVSVAPMVVEFLRARSKSKAKS